MQVQAGEGLRSKILDKTGWDPEYLAKFLGAVRVCQATVQAWLAAATVCADPAGSESAGSGRQRRVKGKEEGEQVEEENKVEKVEDEKEYDEPKVEEEIVKKKKKKKEEEKEEKDASRG